MNNKRGFSSRWLLLLMMIGLSCGVNTGNPTSQQIKTGSTGSSLFLTLKKLDIGTLKLHVNQVLLLPKGADRSSVSAVTLDIAAGTSFSTGQKISLASLEKIPSGRYDRIALVLNQDNPATLNFDDGQSSAVAIAPYQYYETSGLRAADGSVQLLLSLPSGSDVALDGSETVEFESTLSDSVQGFDGIDAGALEYFKSKGALDYVYALKPAAAMTVSSASATDSFLKVLVTQSPRTIQFICLYKKSEVTDPLTYINDLNCARSYAKAEVSVAESQATVNFPLEAGAYIALGRNSELALVYQVEVELKTGERWKLDLALGSLSQE